MRLLAGLVFCAMLTGCGELHTGDHLGPPGAKITESLGDNWYVVEWKGYRYLIKTDSNQSNTNIKNITPIGVGQLDR